jgi:molybdate transport system substrate-binding protein
MVKNSIIRVPNTALKIKTFIIYLSLICLLFNLPKFALAKDPGALTIFSESSMTYALAKIAGHYSKKENVAISVDFNSSFDLINNIDLGEPADIFISSHIDWVKNLTQKGLVDHYSSLNFAKDNLVLVTSKQNKKINLEEISELKNFNNILEVVINKRAPLIIGSEDSSLGRYTKDILIGSKISNFRIFKKLNEDKKSIINFVNNHPEYCAIVMESDIKDDNNIVILSRVPKIKINYHALVIAGDNMDNARRFIKYLKSDEARSILTEYGFILN